MFVQVSPDRAVGRKHEQRSYHAYSRARNAAALRTTGATRTLDALSSDVRMFYFFQRDSDLLRCEVRRAADGDGYEISVIEGDGAERIEHLDTSEQVHQRWLELHKDFEEQGWKGPVTQDGRG
jgi:hypothetical protein